MKPLVIYHANCTDGFGAAWAAWMKYGGAAEYIPLAYKPGLTAPSTAGREVYILDFSFDTVTMVRIFQESKHAGWRDHHKTSFEAWCDGTVADGEREFYTSSGPKMDVMLDNNKSGALLAWEYFLPAVEVPYMVRLIDDRDRWQFDLPETQAFHAALQSIKPWSFEQWEILAKRLKRPQVFREFIAEGEAILRAQKVHVSEVLGGASPCTILGKKGLALNVSHFQSEIGHALAQISGTYGLVWRLGQDGLVNCGLRSTGDFDVSKMAKHYGGGGHLNAAGCQVKLETFLGWIK